MRFSFVTVLTLLPSLVLAAERPSFKPKVEIEHRFLNSTGLVDTGGQFAFNANKISISNLFASFDYERWGLDWKEVDKLPFGDGRNQPVEQMHSVRLAGRYMHRHNSNLLWLNTLGVSATYEKDQNDSLSYSLFSMWIRQLDKGWALSYGLSVNYHPVRTRVLPVAGFSYRMHAPLGWSGTLGYPRSYVAYGFSPTWQVNAGVVNNSVVAKLAKDSRLSENGYAEINAWQANLALKYQPSAQWSIETGLRYSPKYAFSVFDAQGRRDATYQMNRTAGAALTFSYQF